MTAYYRHKWPVSYITDVSAHLSSDCDEFDEGVSEALSLLPLQDWDDPNWTQVAQ